MNRQKLEELLPFYANFTLEGEERKEVEQALHDYSELRGELDYLASLRHEMQAMAMEPGPGELGLKRLQKAITQDELRADPITRAHASIAPEQNNRLWRSVAVAACLLLVLQTGVMLHMRNAANGDLVAANAPALTEEENPALFLVTFAPQASEAAIRDLLIIMNAEIVGGPSAIGVYRVSGGDDPEATRQVLQSSNLVEDFQEAGN